MSFLENFNILEILIRVPLVLIALSFHEWGHAFAAYKLGDPTARNLGRMTLDPIKHIDIMGLICMVLFRFGWAKPVPVNPRNFTHLRRDDTIVSLAGITVNFLLAFVTTGVIFLAYYVFKVPNGIFYNIMENFVFLNLALMVFNLLPIPPLDGYHVLKNALHRVRPQFWWNYERYGSIVLVVVLISGSLTILSFLIGGISNGLVWFYDQIFGLML